MLDRNSVLEVLGKYYFEDIVSFTMDYVIELSDYELNTIFSGELVDYAILDSIDEMQVSDIEVEEDGDDEIVSGILWFQAFMDGYAHWDREEHYLGSGEAEISFEFRFCMRGGKAVTGIWLKERN
jgi:hypothetical protein